MRRDSIPRGGARKSAGRLRPARREGGFALIGALALLVVLGSRDYVFREIQASPVL